MSELPQSNKETSLAQNQQTKLSTSFLPEIARRKNIDEEKMAIAVRGHGSQIRRMDPLDSKKGLITVLNHVSKSYGARVQIDPKVMGECVTLVEKKFGMLGLKEIVEAYRQWAAKEFILDGAAMYGGVFNADQLAKVLTGYMDNRKRVLAVYLNALHTKAEKEAKAAHEKKLKENFIPTFIERVKAFRESGKGWKHIPAFWWFVYDRKWIEVDEDTASDIMKSARDLKSEIEAENEAEESNAKLMGEFVRSQKNKNIVKEIAKRLTIYQFIIMDDSWEEIALEDFKNGKY